MSGNPNKVYVGGLHEDTKKPDLEDFFKDMGTITSVWIARQPPGFGFVEFEDERDAADACKRLNGMELLGRALSVEISGGRKPGKRSRSPRRSRSRGRRSHSRGRRRSPSRGNRYSGGGPPPDTATMTTLKIGNLSRRTDQHDLRRHFDKYGEIGDVYIPLDPRSKDPRGFAFVRFHNKRDAKDAEKALDGSRLDGRVLEVQMAKYGRPDRYGEAKKVSRSGSPRRSRSRPRRSRSRSSKRSTSRSRSAKRDRGRKKRSSTSKDRKRSSSRKRSASPKDRKRSESPKDKKRSASPKDRKRSPSPKDRKRSASPKDKKRSASPNEHRRSESPKEKSKSKSRSPSPQKDPSTQDPSINVSPNEGSRSRSHS